jgi:hypothetical protein
MSKQQKERVIVLHLCWADERPPRQQHRATAGRKTRAFSSTFFYVFSVPTLSWQQLIALLYTNAHCFNIKLKAVSHLLSVDGQPRQPTIHRLCKGVDETVFAHAPAENTFSPEHFLCLSRACLGKPITFV